MIDGLDQVASMAHARESLDLPGVTATVNFAATLNRQGLLRCRTTGVGMLNPVIAGAAMALSSVSVVSNSLLLRRWRPKA